MAKIIISLILLSVSVIASESPQADIQKVSYGDYLFNEYGKTKNPKIAKQYQNWKNEHGDCDAMRLIVEANEAQKRMSK